MKVVVLYLPVPHRGYKEFFLDHSDAQIFFILSNEVTKEFSHLRKNVPAVPAEEVVAAVNAMNWTLPPVVLAGRNALSVIDYPDTIVYLPDEDVSRGIAEKYLWHCTTVFHQVFLRWDKQASTAKLDVAPDCLISTDEFDRKVIASLDEQKENSADFWRQVAGAVVKDREIILFAHNSHVPDFENPYFYGDPRFNFSRGVEIELGTAEHAERRLISLCARQGIVTEGASLYVTTFPCPACAKAIASAGFAKCYFSEGYTMLDAEIVLRAANVELIQVK